jgi:hypothetical protein
MQAWAVAASGICRLPKGRKVSLYKLATLFTSYDCSRFDIVDIPFLIQLQREFSSGIKQVIWTYNVNCKYSVNLHSRSFYNPYSPLSAIYQDNLKDPNSLLCLVNVWHGNAHKPECADKHSIRNTPNTGMVSGEEVETTWVKPNRKQYEAREMDAGGRQDLMTAVFVENNERKIEGMGRLCNSSTPRLLAYPFAGRRLEDHYIRAVKEMEQHQADFNELEALISDMNPAAVAHYRELYQ